MSVAEFMVLRARVTALEAVVAELTIRIEHMEQPGKVQPVLQFEAGENGVIGAVVKRGPGRPRKIDSE